MGWAKCLEDNIEMIWEREPFITLIAQPMQLKNEGAVTLPHSVTATQPSLKKQYRAKRQHRKTKYIICSDCGSTFPFSEKSRKFFASNNWPDPKRCKSCREKRKSKIELKYQGEEI